MKLWSNSAPVAESCNCLAHIYDISHNGIRATGLENSLVAGNYFHGLDDGDTSWNKHCDGIHIFIAGSSIESNLKPTTPSPSR